MKKHFFDMEDKRLLFKFYKSYFDVACELSDKDRLAFYDAIMNREFYGIQPNLSGMAKFAYISQKHSIDAQVEGWEIKMKMQLSDNHGSIGGTLQEKEKEKEKEQIQEKEKEEIYTCFSFDDFWKMYAKSSDKKTCEKKYAKLTEKERMEIKTKLPLYLSTITDKKYQKNPLTYLNGKCWNDIDLNSQQQTQQKSTKGLFEIPAQWKREQ